MARFYTYKLGLLFWLAVGVVAQAQPLPFSSPRQTALAGLVPPLADGMAPVLMPAALGQLDVPEISVAAGRLFGVGLPVFAAGIAGPVGGQHKAGAGVVRLGTSTLSQTFVAGAYAYTLDYTTLALQVGYYQLALGDAPTAAVPTFTLAGQTQLIPKLTLCGQVSNITQPKLTQQTTERLPASLRATALYQPSNDLWLLLQTDKTLNRSAGMAVGIEYRVHRYVRLRCGAAPWPGLLGAGIRADAWGAVLEYGLAVHGLLGQVHSLGIGFSLLPKEKIELKTESAGL